MMRLSSKKLAVFQRAEFLSPMDLVQRAGTIGLLFLMAHLAGFREFASALNGTVGSVALGWNFSAFLAVVYIFLYLAFVILVPVMILAALIPTVWQWFNRGQTK